ncbi:thiamine-monophosphate kinase, partial [Paenibacillus sepulcri]|nr:thiamine-monophosphate kinase [Paenibacillus sepulcri]
LEWILNGGEDYVLLGTISGSDAAAAKAELMEAGLPLYLIGEVEAGQASVEMITEGKAGIDPNRQYPKQRTRIDKRGYNHFTD